MKLIICGGEEMNCQSLNQRNLAVVCSSGLQSKWAVSEKSHPCYVNEQTESSSESGQIGRKLQPEYIRVRI